MPATNRLPQLPNQVLTYSGDWTASANIVVFAVVVQSGKFVLNGGLPQAALSISQGNLYVFSQNDASNIGYPLGLSLSTDGIHEPSNGAIFGVGVTYELDGIEVTWLQYQSNFNAASSRSLKFIPSMPGEYALIMVFIGPCHTHITFWGIVWSLRVCISISRSGHCFV